MSIADSASFNGVNWLKADTFDTSSLSTQLVSGFTRSANGMIGLQFMDMDLSKIVLFNAKGGGVLQSGGMGNAGGLLPALQNWQAAGPTYYRDYPFTSAFKINTGDSISFDVVKVPNPSSSFHVVVNRSIVDLALGPSAGGVVSSASDMIDILNTAFSQAGGSLSDAHAGNSGSTRFNFSFPNDVHTFANISKVDAPTGLVNPSTGIMDIDVTTPDVDLDDYIAQVEVMLQSVTCAATTLGATDKRVTMQSTFTESLMDTITKGIGRLINADMNETSTRLKAITAQQQLGVQALSIANSNSESILQLFR